MIDITTDFANEGIRQADRIKDELDEFMKKLEDAGILSGWSQFVTDRPHCAEAQREYEAAVEDQQYCERYEPTYNPDDGSM